MRKIAITGITLAFLFLSACQAKPANETVNVAAGAYRNISPAELNSMLRSKDFVLVNVHTPPAGTIAGTDLSIPYDQVEQRASELPGDKSAQIVLYCRSGHMSSIAAETLIRLGYTNIASLKGGTAAWEQAGFLIQGP